MMQARARRIIAGCSRPFHIAQWELRPRISTFGSMLRLPYARIALRATSNFPH
jgi:hypothetical protein